MTTEPLKIAFCTDGIFPHKVGGIQRHSRLLIEELATQEHISITVFHPHKTGVFKDFPNVSEVSITDIDDQKNYLLELYRYSKRIYEHLKDMDDHIIYAQGPSVWYAMNRLKNRVIINPHGLEPFQSLTFRDWLTGFPFRLILSRLFRKAKFTVSLGGQLTDILSSKIDQSKIVVLPNAVSPPRHLNGFTKNGTQAEKVKILFVGRFASNKGIHILMEAIRQLNDAGYTHRLEFNLAGKGPLYERYRTKYDLPNVNFLGFVSDEQLKKLYAHSDLFVLPTLFEGMPTVVLEAMAYRLPVIVTDVGATAELVDHTNGYLISKNDSKALKNAMVQFLELPNVKKEELGSRSLAKVQQRFTWPQVAKEHKKLFTHLHHQLQSSE